MGILKELFLENFLYDPNKPLLFTHMFFWIFFLLILLGYAIFYRWKSLRNAYLFFISLYFYYKCGGGLVWLLIFSIVATYFIGIGIYKSRSNSTTAFSKVIAEKRY